MSCICDREMNVNEFRMALQITEGVMQIAERGLQNAKVLLQNAQGSLQIATNLRERSKENKKKYIKKRKKER